MSLLSELYFSDTKQSEVEEPITPALSVSASEPEIGGPEQLPQNIADWQARCSERDPDCKFKRYGDFGPNSAYANMYLAYGTAGGINSYYGMANDTGEVDLDEPTSIEAGTLHSIMPSFDGDYSGGEEEESIMRTMDHFCRGEIS